LSLLLRARDEETDGGGIYDRQIRDEVMTVLLAGHETTAATLSWTLYLLDRHRDVAERLRSDALGALGDRDPTEDLPQLEGATRVIEEAMRLYPPAWIIARVATEEDEIGGHRLAPGTVVTLSPYLTHRSAEVWPEPERFDPDRFTAERSAERPRFAYFPFAGGPRQCIGSEFALTEATLVLATALDGLVGRRLLLCRRSGKDDSPRTASDGRAKDVPSSPGRPANPAIIGSLDRRTHSAGRHRPSGSR
jgi:cytochrome P450